MVFVIGLFLWLLPFTVEAATITASSCNNTAAQPHVQTAINAAVNGDTVSIPAGACSWTSPVTISGKYLTVEGAGIGVTVITDAFTGTPGIAAANRVFVWNTVGGGVSRLTGIELRGNGYGDGNQGNLVFTGQSHQLRVDHCKFVATGTSSIFIYGGIWGVFDHNTFDLSANAGFGVYRFHNDWTVAASDYGDYSWFAGPTLGTEQALYFEDNTFTNDQTVNFHNYATDAWSGSRSVFRFNTFVATTLSNHGTESPGRWRGERQFEHYYNTFTWNMQGNNFEHLIDIRSGTGVVFGNTATISSPSTGLTTLAVLKVFRVSTFFAPWGRCNGSSTYDGNTLPAGYPCVDQVGFSGGALMRSDPPINQTTGTAVWPGQARDPAYFFLNTVNGASVNALSAYATYITADREFFNTVTSFTGASGVGSGVRTSRPVSPTLAQVAYWSTDQGGNWQTLNGTANDGCLDIWSGSVWVNCAYTPYTYPHPLVGAADTTPPAAPTGLVISQRGLVDGH